MKNKMTEKLFELAYTDSMTEVQNRNAYEERLKKLRKPNANISRITVIVVDVNGLKEINDSYGHFSGDDAIKTVAKALRDTIGLKGDIYRIGGDEFLVLIPGITENLFQSMIRSMLVDMAKSSVHLALGSVWVDDCTGKVEKSLSEADARNAISIINQ